MRTRILGFGILLAALLHLDWHLARPHHEHHGLSLNIGFEWQYHWIATALLFAIVATIIVRRWPAEGLAIAAGAFAIGVFAEQGFDPMFESIAFFGHFGYVNEPGRWVAFGQAMAAVTPVYALALWLGSRGERARPRGE
jgi:hypothetical protein